MGFRRFLLVVDGVLWLEIKMELGCGCFRSTGSNKKEGKEAWVFGSGFCIAAVSPDFEVLAARKINEGKITYIHIFIYHIFYYSLPF